MPEISLTADTPASVAYFNAPGLSHSGMKDLMVSPLRYWARNIDPNRVKEEPTPAMIFGSALHCAFLEPAKFDSRYAPELDKSAFENLLVTVDDIRQFIRDKGQTPKATKKDDLIGQAYALEPDVKIWPDLQLMHELAHSGKTLLSVDDWARLQGCLKALRQEPRIMGIMSNGEAEVPLFAIDKQTGVALKGKTDWLNPETTFDLKTFVQMRGKSIDKSVTDAIWYEGYYRQAVMYTRLRTMIEPKSQPDFIMAFVESEPPHEVRIRAVRPTVAGQPNLYWIRGSSDIDSLIWKYADCVKRFGDRPWIDGQEINPLIDEEIPQLAY